MEKREKDLCMIDRWLNRSVAQSVIAKWKNKYVILGRAEEEEQLDAFTGGTDS